MNALAIDYTELTESLSKLSPDELRGLKNYVFATYPHLAPKDEHRHGLADICKAKVLRRLTT